MVRRRVASWLEAAVISVSQRIPGTGEVIFPLLGQRCISRHPDAQKPDRGNFRPKGKWGRYEGSILRYADGLVVLYSSLGIIKPVIKLGNGSSQPIGLKRQGSRTPTKPRRRCSFLCAHCSSRLWTLIMGEGGSHHSTSSGRHELLE